MTSMAVIQDFLAQKRIAVVGCRAIQKIFREGCCAACASMDTTP